MLKIYPSKTKPTKVSCPWVKEYKMHLILYCLRYIYAYKLFRDSKLEAVRNGGKKEPVFLAQTRALCKKKKKRLTYNIPLKPIGYIFNNTSLI